MDDEQWSGLMNEAGRRRIPAHHNLQRAALRSVDADPLRFRHSDCSGSADR